MTHRYTIHRPPTGRIDTDDLGAARRVAGRTGYIVDGLTKQVVHGSDHAARLDREVRSFALAPMQPQPCQQQQAQASAPADRPAPTFRCYSTRPDGTTLACTDTRTPHGKSAVGIVLDVRTGDDPQGDIARVARCLDVPVEQVRQAATRALDEYRAVVRDATVDIHAQPVQQQQARAGAAVHHPLPPAALSTLALGFAAVHRTAPTRALTRALDDLVGQIVSGVRPSDALIAAHRQLAPAPRSRIRRRVAHGRNPATLYFRTPSTTAVPAGARAA